MIANRANFEFDADGTVLKLDSLRSPGGGGIYQPRATLGHCLQVPGGGSGDGAGRASGERGPHRQAGAAGAPATATDRGQHGQPATLHNEDYVRDLDLRVGDTVVVRKSGGVIPQIMRVLVEKRPEGTQPYAFPTHCPECGHEAVRTEGDANTYCPNPACPAQQFERIRYFVSRGAMDVRGIGESWWPN